MKMGECGCGGYYRRILANAFREERVYMFILCTRCGVVILSEISDNVLEDDIINRLICKMHDKVVRINLGDYTAFN